MRQSHMSSEVEKSSSEVEKSARAATQPRVTSHQLIHSKSEKIALVKKAEAKDCKLRFLERENARLRRLLLHANI